MKKIVTLILLTCITLASVAQVVVDPKGTKVAMDTSKWKTSGNDIYNKNTGNTGIGTSNPAYKLDVSAAANPVRMMGVQNGSTTDSVVTIVNGVIKKIAAASFNKIDSTTASNGLNINGLDVQLGGNLTGTTTITNNGNPFTIATGGSALNITGLTSGATTDSILTINPSTGKISRISPASATGDATTASNGLTASGTDIQLGGTLTKATTLTTSSTNTLNFKGIQTGNSTDSLLLIGTGGAIRKYAPDVMFDAMVNNGFTINNGLTGSSNNSTIRLGGSLIQNTTITNNGNTLSFATGGSSLNITGLTAGAATDSVLTVSSTGKVNRVNRSDFAASSTTNALSLSSNTLTSTVNGVAATSNAVSGVSNTSSANNLTTTVNGVTGTAVPMVNSISNTSSGNNLTTTVNGVAATAVPMINSNSLSISNGALTSTVNGIASSPAVNVLTAANNGLTATNGTVQLGGSLTGATTIATAGNALNITGLTAGSATDSIVTINTSTGKLSRISASALSSSGGSNTASNGLTLSGSDIQLGGALTAATTLTTSSSNTLTLLGVQTGTTADSLLVLGSNSEIKKVVQMPTPQYAIVNSDLTLSNANSAQSALPSDRNTFTATASTIYEVEGNYIITTGTSNNKSTAISFGGTATANYVALNAIGWNAATGSTTSTQGSTAVITLSSTVITASSNLSGVHISFKGIISVNAGGTLIPQITFSNSPGGANTMKAGSYVKFTPLLGSVNGSFN